MYWSRYAWNLDSIRDTNMSKNITITIDDDQEELLKDYALGNSLTREEYASNIVKGWLDSQAAGYYAAEINKKTKAQKKTLLGKPRP